MTNIRLVEDALSSLFGVFEVRDGVRVTTHCVYPSNSFVDVMVRGGEHTFYVSDDGAAIREIEAAGAAIEKPDKLIASIVDSWGLHIAKGAISSPYCGKDSLGVAVALVANASRAAAEHLFSHMKIKPDRDFKKLVSAFLRAKYHGSVRSDILVGGSNTPHSFDNIVFLAGNKRLIIDPVLNDMKSINARVVANVDVKAAGLGDIEQRIVYDDQDEWKLETLNLLQVGAPVVPYSKMPQVLQRLELIHASN